MKIDSIEALIKRTETDERFDMKVGEARGIKAKYGGQLDAIYIAFLFGYAQGTKAAQQPAQPNGKSVARAILRALGYTPATLAADLDTSVYKARRILNPKGTIYSDEIFEICRVTGIEPNTMVGRYIPGERRTQINEREVQA